MIERPAGPVVQRPARPADVPAIVDLYCRYEERFRGAPDTDAEDITGDWSSRGFDLAENTLVLERDGVPLGYAVWDGDGFSDSITALETTELTGPLLDWLESRGAPLEHYVPDTDPQFAALLEQRGWEPARRFWRMRRELDGPTPEPVWPAGIRVRDYDRPADDRAVHRLITESFKEIGGQHERTLEQWSGFLLETERYDPSLYLVAVDEAGEVVGAALSQDVADYGFVRQLAVDPSQRGRGLALALLHEVFRRHAARGLPATALGVDAANPTGALVLYEKAGMRVHEQFTRWDRPAAE